MLSRPKATRLTITGAEPPKSTPPHSALPLAGIQLLLLPYWPSVRPATLWLAGYPGMTLLAIAVAPAMRARLPVPLAAS